MCFINGGKGKGCTSKRYQNNIHIITSTIFSKLSTEVILNGSEKTREDYSWKGRFSDPRILKRLGLFKGPGLLFILGLGLWSEVFKLVINYLFWRSFFPSTPYFWLSALVAVFTWSLMRISREEDVERLFCGNSQILVTAVVQTINLSHGLWQYLGIN